LEAQASEQSKGPLPWQAKLDAEMERRSKDVATAWADDVLSPGKVARTPPQPVQGENNQTRDDSDASDGSPTPRGSNDPASKRLRVDSSLGRRRSARTSSQPAKQSGRDAGPGIDAGPIAYDEDQFEPRPSRSRSKRKSNTKGKGRGD